MKIKNFIQGCHKGSKVQKCQENQKKKRKFKKKWGFLKKMSGYFIQTCSFKKVYHHLNCILLVLFLKNFSSGVRQGRTINIETFEFLAIRVLRQPYIVTSQESTHRLFTAKMLLNERTQLNESQIYIYYISYFLIINLIEYSMMTFFVYKKSFNQAVHIYKEFLINIVYFCTKYFYTSLFFSYLRLNLSYIEFKKNINL